MISIKAEPTAEDAIATLGKELDKNCVLFAAMMSHITVEQAEKMLGISYAQMQEDVKMKAEYGAKLVAEKEAAEKKPAERQPWFPNPHIFGTNFDATKSNG